MTVDAAGGDDWLELEKPSLLSLLWCFLRIGTTGFGGSSRAMMHAEAVERRRWLRPDDFLTGFAIAQVLPGANPVNLALYIGLRTRGLAGATAAVLGMIGPAFCIIILIGLIYSQLSVFPVTHVVLLGVAAAGVAATLALGLKVAARIERRMATALVGFGTFLAVGVFRIPTIPVVALAVPISIAFAYRAERNKRRD